MNYDDDDVDRACSSPTTQRQSTRTCMRKTPLQVGYSVSNSMKAGWFVCGWQVKLCNPLITHGPYLSALVIKDLYIKCNKNSSVYLYLLLLRLVI